MAKLSINVEYDDIALNAIQSPQDKILNLNIVNKAISLRTQTPTSAVMNVANTTIVRTLPSELISSDPDNDLQLGSDDKLLSQPPSANFLAYYLLNRG